MSKWPLLRIYQLIPNCQPPTSQIMFLGEENLCWITTFKAESIIPEPPNAIIKFGSHHLQTSTKSKGHSKDNHHL